MYFVYNVYVVNLCFDILFVKHFPPALVRLDLKKSAKWNNA